MIEVKDLNKAYNDITIFDHFNCKFEDGDLVAIIGRSGSGKSTLLNIIGLLDKQYEGQIIFDGLDVTTLKTKERKAIIRDKISYLFQNYALIEEESIYDNLILALSYTKYTQQEKTEKIKKALKIVQLEKDIYTKIHTLSGGEQQRISFARTILKPSQIILADEPTGNLDSYNKMQILDLLMTLNKMGKTVIIVTHDQEISDACNTSIRL